MAPDLATRLASEDPPGQAYTPSSFSGSGPVGVGQALLPPHRWPEPGLAGLWVHLPRHSTRAWSSLDAGWMAQGRGLAVSREPQSQRSSQPRGGQGRSGGAGQPPASRGGEGPESGRTKPAPGPCACSRRPGRGLVRAPRGPHGARTREQAGVGTLALEQASETAPPAIPGPSTRVPAGQPTELGSPSPAAPLPGRAYGGRGLGPGLVGAERG